MPFLIYSGFAKRCIPFKSMPQHTASFGDLPLEIRLSILQTARKNAFKDKINRFDTKSQFMTVPSVEYRDRVRMYTVTIPIRQGAILLYHIYRSRFYYHYEIYCTDEKTPCLEFFVNMGRNDSYHLSNVYVNCGCRLEQYGLKGTTIMGKGYTE